MATKDELIAEAEERGIEVSPSWTKAMLEQALAEEKEGTTYRNVSKVTVFVFGIRVKPGKSFTLTEANKQDERGLAKLSRLAEFGMVE